MKCIVVKVLDGCSMSNPGGTHLNATRPDVSIPVQAIAQNLWSGNGTIQNQKQLFMKEESDVH